MVRGGGLLMRAFKVLLLVLTLAIFTASVRADGIPDPTVTVQPSGKSTPTTDGGSAADPIFVTDGSGTTNWYLDSPTVAADGLLYVEIIPYEGENIGTFLAEAWNCSIDPPTTTACGIVPSPQGLLSNAVLQGFTYIGDCTTPYSDPTACPAVEAVFSGPFTYNEDIGISVPEPRSVLLLLIGFPVVLAFGVKKRNLL